MQLIYCTGNISKTINANCKQTGNIADIAGIAKKKCPDCWYFTGNIDALVFDRKYCWNCLYLTRKIAKIADIWQEMLMLHRNIDETASIWQETAFVWPVMLRLLILSRKIAQTADTGQAIWLKIACTVSYHWTGNTAELKRNCCTHFGH